jgi:hypothetical protein
VERLGELMGGKADAPTTAEWNLPALMAWHGDEACAEGNIATEK